MQIIKVNLYYFLILCQMVQGNFFPSSQLGSAGGGVGGGVDSRQVALGCSSGSIYIFYNMSVSV